MSSHRSRTRRKTVLWQGATLLLAAGAVGLLVLPIGNVIRPASANWDGKSTSGPLPQAGGEVATLSLSDAQGIGDILLALNPSKAPGETAEPTPPTEEVVEPGEAVAVITPPHPATPASKANWVYLGSAVTPRASRALVRIDQAQRFVRQGSDVDGVKLLEVHDDHIMVEEAGLQKRIERVAMPAGAMLPTRGPATAGAAKAGAGAPAAQTPPAPTPPANSAAAALAAAQAAHGKAKGAPVVPGRLVARVMQLSPEQRASTYATMTSPTSSYEDRIKAISELGFDAASPLEERREAIRAIGLNPDDPDVARILEDEMNGAARNER